METQRLVGEEGLAPAEARRRIVTTFGGHHAIAAAATAALSSGRRSLSRNRSFRMME